ncbi:odorant receptor 85c-like [Vespa mandarinia]|uniref:odorant receptor 85c-like n=1 Tax=Vespa mandarinia TaxID=7446 RepID=UPI001612A715|nr:odorant receptor 85c-like [Vespa mandarinia]
MISTNVSPINRLVEYSLRFIGLWPDYSYVIAHRFLWIITMSLTLIFQYWYVIVNLKSDDLPDLMDCLSITMSNTVFFIKLIILWMKNRDDILKMMINDWLDSIDKKENHETMSNRVTLSQRYSSFFVSSYSIGVTFFLSFALFTQERQLILKMELPFDTTKSPIYELINVIQFIQEFMAASMSSMLSALLVTLILHVDGQVEIICRQLSDISSIIRKGEYNSEILKILIYKHQRIIAFTDNIENIFTYIALIQFLSNTLVICSLGFMIVTVNKFSFSFQSLDSDQRNVILAKTVPYYVLANLEAFALCYAGEYLSSKSTDIEKAAYHLNWYELDPSDSRFLLVLMIRSQKRFVITTGKFMNLSLEVFASMLKASGSYVSVLYAMY